ADMDRRALTAQRDPVEPHRPDEVHRELQGGVAGALGQGGVHGAAHRGVEEGAVDAAVQRAERVAEVRPVRSPNTTRPGSRVSTDMSSSLPMPPHPFSNSSFN